MADTQQRMALMQTPETQRMVLLASAICLLAILTGCEPKARRLTVTATAFNSTVAQTDRRPTESACGNRIAPGDKIVAVSHDLVQAGMTCGTEIRIKGLEGSWKVLDHMASDRKMRIDIYMGRDLKAARAWGTQQVEISWN
jgi:3D (Asp-Asp-Asp) domain-containing protein